MRSSKCATVRVGQRDVGAAWRERGARVGRATELLKRATALWAASGVRGCARGHVRDAGGALFAGPLAARLSDVTPILNSQPPSLGSFLVFVQCNDRCADVHFVMDCPFPVV